MIDSSPTPRPSEFVLRAPDWWRDVVLGVLFGGALIWAFADAIHWKTFKHHLVGELVWVGIPCCLALLSPRRLLTLSLALSLILFRCIFFIFLIQNIWGALGTVVWLLIWVWLAIRVNRKYGNELARAPNDTTILEFIILIISLGGGFYVLYLLRHAFGLG